MAYREKDREWKPDLTPTVVHITARVMCGGQPWKPGDKITCSRQDALTLVDLKRGEIVGPAGPAE